jgi:hypothetical protein
MLPLLIATAFAVPETVTVAVWMAGDNNLEHLLKGDLNELEGMVSDRVSVLAQVDRIPLYDIGDGDWSDTRRYDMLPDRTRAVVTEPVEFLGEVNMGSGDALADFLLWANERHPADRFVVVMWNHGGGFWIASDDTDDDQIDIQDGELSAALQAVVDARGAKIDVVAFDACNMAEWELATAIADQAHVMTASSAFVGNRGYAYHEAFANLPDVASGTALGAALAYSAGVTNRELTHSAIDLDRIDMLTEAVDELAVAWLAAGPETFIAARDQARGLDTVWEDWWIDVGEIADQAALSDPALEGPAAAVRDALDDVIIANHTQPQVAFSSGLTIFADTSLRRWVRDYREGPWATTAWDELLYEAGSSLQNAQ